MALRPSERSMFRIVIALFRLELHICCLLILHQILLWLSLSLLLLTWSGMSGQMFCCVNNLHIYIVHTLVKYVVNLTLEPGINEPTNSTFNLIPIFFLASILGKKRCKKNAFTYVNEIQYPLHLYPTWRNWREKDSCHQRILC